MTEKADVNGFLMKIGVTLPQPKSMEGFGMELPDRYLARCLDVIVPAAEAYLGRQKENVIEDFARYVQAYKEFNGHLPVILQPPVTGQQPATGSVNKHHVSKEQKKQFLLELVQKDSSLLEKPIAVIADLMGVHRTTAGAYINELRKEGLLPEKKGDKENNISPSEPKEETYIPDVKQEGKSVFPVYQEGGYMAGVFWRFANRDRGSNEIGEFYNSLSAETRARAEQEHWADAKVDGQDIRMLELAFTKEQGICFIRYNLSKLEYEMLKKALRERFPSIKEKIAKYPAYLRERVV